MKAEQLFNAKTQFLQQEHLLRHGLYQLSDFNDIRNRLSEMHYIPPELFHRSAIYAATRVLYDRWPQAEKILIVTGEGEKAAIGYQLAIQLREAGADVEIGYLVPPERIANMDPQVLERLAALQIPSRTFSQNTLFDADVVVDALLDSKQMQRLGGDWLGVVLAINRRCAGRILSIGAPSGLCVDTGSLIGNAIHATVTLALLTLKAGFYTGKGPDCTGEIVLDTLGAPKEVLLKNTPRALLFAPDVLQSWLPPRSRVAHRGDHGHVLIIGGDYGMSGAARICGEAALRAGAGSVTIATQKEHAFTLGIGCPSLMVHGIKQPADLNPLLARATVIAIGSGLGQSAWGQQLLDHVLQADLPLIICADGLNCLAAKTDIAPKDWTITPHSLEASRLLQCDLEQVEVDRYSAAKQLSERYGIAVLKGAGSLVADPDGISVNPSGNPGMASAGMGDALVGCIAALRAQGLSARQAARAGVYLHGLAGDRAAQEYGERGMVASDLIHQLRGAVNV